MVPPAVPPKDPQASKRRSPSSRVVHETIVLEGLEELGRPLTGLIWSAIAAGLSLGFSLIAQAALRAHLPEAEWSPLLTKLGYSVGFLIVILGRQQLFTENTLTPILAWLDRETPAALPHVLRLWGAVLGGNLIGAIAIALALAHTDLLSEEMKAAAAEIGREALAPSFGVVLLRAVVAGWLIALIVWLRPAAQMAHLWVIVIITWVIGIGHFSHVVAGSIDVFALASAGHATWVEVLVGFTLPALIGNIIGGVMLVAFLNHAQVKSGEE